MTTRDTALGLSSAKVLSGPLSGPVDTEADTSSEIPEEEIIAFVNMVMTDKPATGTNWRRATVRSTMPHVETLHQKRMANNNQRRSRDG
ncbi:hypothetical protein ElyMa_005664800 [Elysia marginata]|uniref:BEN domain-containing protein n=1 Tax=Elysia marginata TaxID=1093978 RepID=A0AAV4FC71_9GAST|nr:hypothetical protein ElyMa_005664800 [Elysia marginata]